MTTKMATSRQMEMVIKLGHMMVNRQTKLRQIKDKIAAKREIIFIEEEILDLKYIVNSGCSSDSVKYIYNNTMSDNLRSTLTPYLKGDNR